MKQKPIANHIASHIAKSLTLIFSISIFYISAASGALVVNPAATIIGQVKIQPIVVSDDNGTNTATYFGNASQQSSILGLVDEVWAQAGLDIEFLSPNFWNSSFANEGSGGPRPSSDLGTIRANGISAGVTNADANVINMFFVNFPAGFSSPLSDNSAAGFAFVGGNGITQYVGENLLGFQNGRDVIASVVSHEIGHNLGLDHNSINQNLMQTGGNDSGERLNAAQIATALNSSFVSAPAPVPVPAAVWFLCSGLFGLIINNRRRPLKSADQNASGFSLTWGKMATA
jgi:hypothetical protein